jgi:MYXO-CTERM domain-containing protein
MQFWRLTLLLGMTAILPVSQASDSAEIERIQAALTETYSSVHTLSLRYHLDPHEDKDLTYYEYLRTPTHERLEIRLGDKVRTIHVFDGRRTQCAEFIKPELERMSRILLTSGRDRQFQSQHSPLWYWGENMADMGSLDQLLPDVVSVADAELDGWKGRMLTFGPLEPVSRSRLVPRKVLVVPERGYLPVWIEHATNTQKNPPIPQMVQELRQVENPDSGTKLWFPVHMSLGEHFDIVVDDVRVNQTVDPDVFVLKPDPTTLIEDRTDPAIIRMRVHDPAAVRTDILDQIVETPRPDVPGVSASPDAGWPLGGWLWAFAGLGLVVVLIRRWRGGA